MSKIEKNKKFNLFLILLLLLLFIFSSCDKNEEPTTSQSTDETISSEIKDETTTENHSEEDFELTSLDFTKANSLINALNNYKTVKITNTSEDNSIYTKNFFMFNEKPVLLEVCKYDGEEEEIFGWYDGYNLKITENGIIAEKYVETMLDSPSFYYEDEISLMFDGKDFSLIKETDESYVFSVTYQQMDVREKRTYTVNKSTLLLQRVDILLEDEFYQSITYEYGVVVDDYGLSAELYGNYKTISLTCVLSDESAEIKADIDLPEAWEFIPLHRVNQLSIYINPDFTEEYVYPGDGISFSMFCTDSAG